MPAEVDPSKKRKQILLIVLLSIGLVVAIMIRDDDSDPQVDSASTSSTPAASVTQVSSSDANDGDLSDDSDERSNPIDTLIRRRNLSRIEWDQLRELELFQHTVPPAEFSRDAQVTQAPVRIEAIYGAANLSPPDSSRENASNSHMTTSQSQGLRRSALVGQAIVQSGEVLPDGRRVVEVTPQGVSVAPASHQ